MAIFTDDWCPFQTNYITYTYILPVSVFYETCPVCTTCLTTVRNLTQKHMSMTLNLSNTHLHSSHALVRHENASRGVQKRQPVRRQSQAEKTEVWVDVPCNAEWWSVKHKVKSYCTLIIISFISVWSLICILLWIMRIEHPIYDHYKPFPRMHQSPYCRYPISQYKKE